MNLTCATHAVQNYMARYATKACNGAPTADCETISRIHRGGPNGCTNPDTHRYWHAIRRCYDG